jgi:glycosyltransferase involved in cell wall biosynthesis
MESMEDISGKPFISVIIPCYNVEEYIEECLDSVFAQTYSFYEVIIVDNNSSDETLKRITGYLEKNNKKALVLSESRQGATFTRNLGLAFAKGYWVQFLDADDILLREKIHHQVSLINDSYSIIAASTFEKNYDGKITQKNPNKDVVYSLFMGHRSLGSTCSNLWKRSALIDLDGFNTNQEYGQEYDLMFRLILSGNNVLFDYKPLTIIRRREFGQMSQNDLSDISKSILELMFRQLQHFSTNNSEWPLSDDKMTSILKNFSYRIHLQSKKYLKLSHTQYHDLLMPSFRPFLKFLNFKDRVKHRLYLIIGFSFSRQIISVFK